MCSLKKTDLNHQDVHNKIYPIVLPKLPQSHQGSQSSLPSIHLFLLSQWRILPLNSDMTWVIAKNLSHIWSLKLKQGSEAFFLQPNNSWFCRNGLHPFIWALILAILGGLTDGWSKCQIEKKQVLLLKKMFKQSSYALDLHIGSTTIRRRHISRPIWFIQGTRVFRRRPCFTRR